MALSVGTRLGPYEILAPIGAGGMGEVYKARDTRLDRTVAIKILPPEKTVDPERKRRFIQEAKAASALNHPNIVTIYDIGSEHGMDFIVMEFIQGKPLDRLIPRNGMRMNDALSAAIPVADALAKAHNNGIIHRDLKPGNIMISDEGVPKLLDFGLAKLVENVPANDMIETEEMTGAEAIKKHSHATDTAPFTEEGAILGTVAYMSPEQAEGKAIDARSDIFSFGSVFYEMLTGRKAFRGESRVATLAAILHHDPKPLNDSSDVSNTPTIPRELERMITRCLRKDPSKRWQTMADLRASLQELKEDSDSGLTRSASHTPATAGASAPTHKLAWSIAAVGVIAAIGTAFWAMRGTSTSEAPVKAVPLTSYAGSEQDPSFSPDGTQVAFAWDGEKEDNFDIYVKRVGPGPPLKLTTGPEIEHAPAWSPDGSSIAFLREKASNKADVVLVPPLGGPERIVATVASTGPGNPTRTLGWSPDGKYLVTQDQRTGEPRGLWLVSVESGARQRLTENSRTQDADPLFSSDGRSIVYVRLSGANMSNLQLLELNPSMQPSGEKLLTRGNMAVRAPAWTSDNKEIVFGWGVPGNSSLWRMPLSGSAMPRQIPGTENAAQAAISPKANRLIYSKETRELDVYRVDLDQIGSSATAATPVATSTLLDRYPVVSPDGKKVAFASLRSGGWEVWVADISGGPPVQLSSFGSGEVRTWNWSPDGQNIAFISNADGDFYAYEVAASGGKPRKLDYLGTNADRWKWSRDGKWIFFDRGGQLWKIPPGGGTAIQLTHSGASNTLAEAPEDRIVYYGRPGGVWAVPLDGGIEQQVFKFDGNIQHLDVNKKGIYFVNDATPFKPGRIMFYKFPSGPLVPMQGLEAPTQWGFSLSPDGKQLLYTKFTATGSDLMLVENFK
jgi:eukaryotic-like serine/threonine-protein kinase